MIDLDFRQVLDTFADAVVAADGAGQIVYVNRAAEKLLGWPAAELVGPPLLAIINEVLPCPWIHLLAVWPACARLRR